jgi:hypothetical protein
VSALSVKAAAQLARKIELGLLQDGFTPRDVQRKGWSLLTETDTVRAALDELVAAGWLRETRIRGSWQQKASTTYSINPLIPVPKKISA